MELYQKIKHTAILLIILLTLCNGVKTRSISPLHIVQSPGSILYGYTAPLHFKIGVPTVFNEETLLVLYQDSGAECEGPSIGLGEECGLVFIQQQIRNLIRPLLTTQQSLQKGSSSFPLPLFKDGVCGRVQKSLTPFVRTDKDVFQGLLDELKGCLEGSDVIPRVISNFTSSFRELYSNTYINYISNYFPTPLATADTFTALVYEMLGFGGFIHYLAERSRWEESLNQCKGTKTIPTLLIGEFELKEELLKFEELVTAMGFQLALSTDSATFNSYWSLPTVDCTFTQSDDPASSLDLNVIMQVPLNLRGEEWSFHAATSIPFFTIHGGEGYLCLFGGDSESNLQYEAKGKAARPRNKDATSGHLLQFLGDVEETPYLQDYSLNCPSKIISNASLNEIAAACPPICQKEGDGMEQGVDGIVIKRVSSTLYYGARTGASGGEKSIGYTCRGEGSIRRRVLPMEGALEINLGCGCSFSVGNLNVTAGIPCSNTSLVQMDIVTPIHSGGRILG